FLKLMISENKYDIINIINEMKECIIMKQVIFKAAKLIGIDIIGITDVLDYSYMTDILIKRAADGLDCEFEERDLIKRLDARNVFQNCKSIIAIGVPYAFGYKKPETDNMGLLSVSSYGEDYHKKLNDLLKELAEEIKKYFDFEYKICVDTSPLIDREICKNAGVGNIGKNTLLINENYGSFINLGYLLTDLKIECDNIIKDEDICSDCNICIKSCPNKAIFKDGGINSRRCVSYLTQTKEYIPLEYRKNMKNQIYGCDICQIVCPKNQLNIEKRSNNDYSGLLVDLEEIFEITNKDFSAKYGMLSGSWRGKNVWKRNALIAVGNLSLYHMFDLVKEELSNDSDMIKIYAAWCLVKLDRKAATKILYNCMKNENDTIKREYLKLMEVL
ncbi:MAG: 4Fe-4S ferredoxin, iron-sulpur binding domain protein, partial [Bacillota bacterium]|nr:4Fe-4S ferredoxin, iron-sulpur binding domain protein [Bacillota bacterium]